MGITGWILEGHNTWDCWTFPTLQKGGVKDDSRVLSHGQLSRWHIHSEHIAEGGLCNIEFSLGITKD